MDVNFAQDWPVFILLGAFVTFVVYAFINGRQQEKKNQAAKDKENAKLKA